ncbi:FxsA family protein [Halomonas sp. NO4]|uniref:FxsA family protein n=1 Tax=Halomonas sp. NO4 TaxID=2484813 RepID=UPI0013D285E7|nr:FxsA family protein [Halomonas sp. NO4]
MPFLLFFTLFALLDFVILFSVGGQIGLLTTLGLILTTGFLGLHLVRREGAATFARARQRLEQGEVPSGELLTGAALIFGGALLMAPGFVSDALGFVCVIPGARRVVARVLARFNLGVRGMAYAHRTTHSSSEAGWERTRPDTERQQGSEQRGSDAPLEGDFISRDEPRR